jgi:hypothetical protein
LSSRKPIAAEIPHDLRDADELLHRYGRWAMDRFKKQHCGSAEGKFRIPPNDDDREPREILLKPDDVVAVNRALLAVPERERKVLMILYVPKRLPAEAQLRIARIPPSLSGDRHRDGLRMFWNRYRGHEAAMAQPAV